MKQFTSVLMAAVASVAVQAYSGDEGDFPDIDVNDFEMLRFDNLVDHFNF